jgi:anthranilate phosphoribosyltransferase
MEQTVMIKESIAALVESRSLTFEMAAGAMEEIMAGKATPAQVGAFLTALRMKGETADEIAGLASVMRAHATPVNIASPAIDIVGTGGDASGSFNISTAAAFVVAGAGLKVAKHGNRAASSRCGAADVLEALGVKLDLTAAQVAACIETAGIGFMFAPAFHPAMKYAAPVRRELGIRTVFNILGPLTNPAGVGHLLLGVASQEIGGKMAAVLCRLGIRHALVVHGRHGLDEISIHGQSFVWEVTDDGVSPSREISPEDFGLDEAPSSSMAGGAPTENAAILRRVLEGEKGPRRDVIVINAAAAIVAGDMTKDFKEAARLAAAAIDSGRARQKLDALVAASQGKI